MPGGSQFIFELGWFPCLLCSLPADAPTIEAEEGRSKLVHMSAHSYQHAPRSVPEPCVLHLALRKGTGYADTRWLISILSFASCPRRSEQKLYGEDDHFCDLLARYSMIATDCRIILSSSSRKERRSVGFENLRRDGWR
jgi:hypothetical protein